MSDPAFPFYEPRYPGGKYHHGLTKIEVTCIELRIPRTGDHDLDALIREAQRRDVAAMAMQGMLAQVDDNSSPTTWECDPSSMARIAATCSDALLAELAKPQEVTP